MTDKFPSDFKATIRCFGLARDASVQWRLDDRVLGDPQPVHLDGTTDVTQSHASFPTGGPHVLSLRLFDEDRLQVDNQFQRVIDVTSELKTLIVEGNTRNGVGRLGCVSEVGIGSAERMIRETPTAMSRRS